MKGRGIIFTDESVRAILAGRKTQTRRLMAPQPARVEDHKLLGGADGWCWKHEYWTDEAPRRCIAQHCPIGYPKHRDRLWVRESWRTWERPEDAVDGIRYRADDAFVKIHNSLAGADGWVVAHNNDLHGDSWRPSLFMPRWAARIELRVTEVRVQQLQEINEDDARAEGVGPYWTVPLTERPEDIQRLGVALAGREPGSFKQGYQVAWDSINGRKSLWADNPWVWAVTFEVAEVKTEVLACHVGS